MECNHLDRATIYFKGKLQTLEKMYPKATMQLTYCRHCGKPIELLCMDTGTKKKNTGR